MTMRTVERFNAGWQFHADFHPDLIGGFAGGEEVCLPHNAIDCPLEYFDETAWHRRFCYQTKLVWRPEFANRCLRLRFDGAMADSHVYINGVYAGAHHDGYTPLEVEITDLLHEGVNLVSVVVDGTQIPQIPPFGGQIDYLTYAGLYRDAWLVTHDPVSIDTMVITGESILASDRSATVRCQLRGTGDAVGIRVEMANGSGEQVAEARGVSAQGVAELRLTDLGDVQLWDLDRPVLYTVTANLEHEGSRDAVQLVTGFRRAEFRPNGFFLNGRQIKIRGLNRHQSWPYVGYAMGRRAQERDAEILKFELGCNLVRTAHYPQSPWFLDHCDRIGLLVFPEAPGWQHVGDAVWQDRHLANIAAMIHRDRHHPSIILWGVRINESQDQDALYALANERARTLDPDRQTAGVRNLTESTLLEDVYTMNDFILGEESTPGANRPRTALRPRAEVTGLSQPVPYMVTEFNGHMYPTRREDPEERQIEHVKRYLEILNHSAGDPDIAGCIGWCLADYNTHKDFGAGNRICHHGVLDIFRLPKHAAGVYASQIDPTERQILEPVTCWARGERSRGGVLPLIVLTNCDAVELHFGGATPVVGTPDRETYPHLTHPPVIFSHRDFADGQLGGWGERWQDVTLVGVHEGVTAVIRRMACNPILSALTVVPDHWHLLATEPDDVRVVVTARDQAGNGLHRASLPMTVTVRGPARRLGPAETLIRGGRGAFWIRSMGEQGIVHVEVAVPGQDRTAIALACVDEVERSVT